MTRPPPTDEDALRPLIRSFCDGIRRDPTLAPVFDAAISNWSQHEANLADVWPTVTPTSGRSVAYPAALHLRHAEHLTPELFRRWLSLWRKTVTEAVPAGPADELLAA